jgi:hypothetical protein
VIAAAVRQVADWLADGVTGVNALRLSVPMDNGETAPAAVTIYDETREPWVARGTVPRAKTGTGPLLLVRGPDELAVPIFGTQGNGGYADCEVLVCYVRRAPAAGSTAVESDDAVRDVYQTMRIIARAIALQYTEQEANPSRQSVSLDRPTVRFLRQTAPLSPDGELITGMLSLTFPANDPWAMAAIS